MSIVSHDIKPYINNLCMIDTTTMITIIIKIAISTIGWDPCVDINMQLIGSTRRTIVPTSSPTSSTSEIEE